MALHLHRAQRTDTLADELGELLASPLPDPFAQEVVVVPEQGIERWLAQRLSHRLGTGEGSHDGVCAGVTFLRPRSLVTMLTGRDDDDPWLPQHLVWPLLEVIDAGLGQPWCAALSRHLGHGTDDPDGTRAGRRYSVALRLARLFHRYGQSRPTMLTDWREGRDTDGTGGPLDHDLVWQAELWRRLVGVVDAPPPDVRHAETVAALRDGRGATSSGTGGVTGGGLELPERLSLFGHTRLAVTEVELLHALAGSRDVHLWLPQPSPDLWERLTPFAAEGVVARDDDATSDLVRHPLLASLGRDSRELVRVLGATSGSRGGAPAPSRGAGSDQGPSSGGALEARSVLEWLQADLRDDHVPDESERTARTVPTDDRSIQVHACHGPARQVEVLREVLVGLLDDDPTLEPRDVLVMCPDVETYAPLIGAAFGLGEHGTDADGVDTHPAHRLRVRLADRSLRATNPLLDVADRVVGLAGGRLTASEVLDLAASGPVRRRFGLDDDDLATMTRWVSDSGIRWGYDQAGRAPFALDVEPQGTWRFGLDRLLVGVTVSADGPLQVGGVMPLDDVGSGSVDLVGRVSELLARIGEGLDRLEHAGPATEWMDALTETVLSLTDVPPRERWQVGVLQRTLGSAARHASDDVPLRLADVRVLLADQLAGRPSRASFRTGGLTVCTMTPMRSVPHRVVCLLGMDDDSFPRQQAIDGDDVLARRPMTGERDARSEDRQLLLDAVLAARERLVIAYTGADEHSGEPCPPAVPLGELLDAARETTTAPVEVTHHPLQPFDARNLTVGGPGGGRSFSFDRSALLAARAAVGERTPPGRLVTAPLPGRTVADVGLADLIAFYDNPARGFLRDRLQVGVSHDVDEVSDRLPVDLDALEKWAVGDRALRARIAGQDPRSIYRAELLRGALPPAGLGEATLEEIGRTVEQLMGQLALGPPEDPRSVDIEVTLPGDRRLTGTVDGVRGLHLVDVTYSRLGAKQVMGAWIRLLALTAAGTDDEGWQASTLGKGSRGKVARTSYGVLPREAARSHLTTLLDVFALGQTAPLPLPVKTAHAWAQAVSRNPTRTRLAQQQAAKEWEASLLKSGDTIPGERDDSWWRLVHGREAPFDVLQQTLAGPGSDLATLAPRVWGPALDNVGSTA
ncbi:exodeoxyribonuclease V subunit gamma [Janibacter hoylei]|uniref:exodeoxyribonuclease V subunit gamma n=1 Tax=Janibacter hoylei TaxID=364298 RepID=UPI0021A7B58A|nr:exodeoxyribonuclease V subunit gamma [Janibacter hoylei]MCT1618970.1 exodeoxyribonuclease V subunit gamma [Janibacter hoylei]